VRSSISTLSDHARIVWALMLRELATRYGRDNIGFLWVVFEPLAFCVGVLILWRSIRGPYEQGIQVIPFVLTGYMPTILTRHVVMYSLNAVRVNTSLLYHRQISVLDLFMSRICVEFAGVTLAFFIAYCLLLVFGLAKLPENPFLIYEGWFITALVAGGMALVVGAIAEIVEVVERIIGLTLYILVPLSGTFFLADWLPSNVRQFALLLPFLNCAEMVRSGFFGSAINAHYDAVYTAGCGVVMAVLGLLILRHVRERVEVA
jgi:capsular polysaccharide transport system permease protein